ncbi:tetratricopeptide repeat protein 30A2 [Ditylenchus destructor]|uniref:Tetratricopeptide repeat protein 30 n=1 Tax=Ditylenchus destructor TaxID=166010 RepID=A0AAD4N1K7_9BILA|nr:tetratricopeptide repeat protein 30A2 [Ditylenchus destructor]
MIQFMLQIKESRFTEAMRILQYELQRNPESRAALSLLAFCYYNIQDYIMAAECYAKLTERFPQHVDYKLNHAQALYNAFMFPEAVAILAQIDDPKLESKVVKLDAAIKYREEDLVNARILVEQFASDDPDVEVNLACLDYKEGKFEEALKRFQKATQTHGYQADLTYALALCHYRIKDYPQALRFISEIVDRGIKDYPELGVGMATEGIDVRSVGNTLLLHETALVEACNLKFAIEYKLKDFESAAEALTDMPPRSEEELDPVTLHNQALIGIETNLADSFAKLQYLLGQNPFPPETFANLLLLYCKYEYYDLAADVLAENAHLTYKYLSQYTYDYLDALITQQSSSADAYGKFDALANEQLSAVRKAKLTFEDSRGEIRSKELGKSIEAVEETLERYLPALMSQAKILWEKGDYEQVEKIFRRSSEFCNQNDTWTLNLAHTLFMQEKFKDSADCYAPLVRKNFDKMLQVSAIVLANLCVCYIMTSSNEEAEEVMKRVEKEESALVDKKSFHLSIINLVIGTLYCSKGNYEFGVSRIVRALEPCEKKLGIDTWYYSKRCLMSMIESLAKCVIVVRDDVLSECLKFLDMCEVHGKEISTEANTLFVQENKPSDIRKTVSFEARAIKALLLKMLD